MAREDSIAWLVAEQANLDPVTGFVDRRWFDVALAQPQPLTTPGGVGLGVIAVYLDGLMRLDHDDGPAGRDGWLLIAAEILQRSTHSGDLAARLGDNRFALLTRSSAAGFAETASVLHARLQLAGISARVGWSVAGKLGGSGAALKTAERPGGALDYPALAAEAAASRAIAALRDATTASALHGEAIGILMQWHRCTSDRAERELAYQAHELGLSVTATARLLLGVASGHAIHVPAARGIQLDRTARLANHTAPFQPAWTVEPPNAASTRMRLPHPPASERAYELGIAGRYQAAAGRSGSGGDWFDGFILPDGVVGLVIGDVAGHDTFAVTVMMQLRSLLRGIAESSDIAPSQVLQRLDHGLVELGSDRLATVVFGWIRNDATGHPVLSWCNAGHPAPVVITRDGDARGLPGTNDILLGLGGNPERSDLTFALPADATMLLYSDGLVETRTADIDAGLARLCAAVRPLATRPVSELCDALVPAMVPSHTPDDVTVLAIRVDETASIPDEAGRPGDRSISLRRGPKSSTDIRITERFARTDPL